VRRAGAALALALAAGAGCGEEEPRRGAGKARYQAVDREGSSGARRPAGSGTLTAYVRRTTPLRDRPGGRALATLRRQTEWESPRVLAVVAERPGWLGVLAPELSNHVVGWIPRQGVELFRTDWELEARLSRRELVVRRKGRITQRVRVGIGKPSTPTPPGLYAVTDKLLVKRNDLPYGCCVLALTGHAPRTPQGWGGGDRLAIHGTSDEGSVGLATSNGCLRAGGAAMRRLVHSIPLGTRLRIVA
jgi:hypothetical protein